ncbi:MAG: ATP synthase F1 subunit epsilon [Bacteroidales bacterium]|nr:ATP synthase F1 subunit epsilon [Candidatus Scybalocola fimicaballi]
MKLDIISPDKLIFSGDVESVKLPGTGGGFEVLPHHAAIISSLKEGEIVYVSGGETTTLRVDGGFAEVRNDEISVCVEKVLE